MDPQIAKLTEQLSQAHWIAVISTLISVLLAALLAFLTAYLKRKGEQFATREDFKQLLSQAEQTTKVTESIKSHILAGASVGQSELDFRKAQLADFYGPIYARLSVSGNLYELWREQKVTEINLEIIDFFRGQNEAIINIITNRAHLIDGDGIPDVFTKYITSVTIWNFYTRRQGKPWIEDHVAKLPQARWPEEFRDYIATKTQELKRRLDLLHRKYTIE